MKNLLKLLLLALLTTAATRSNAQMVSSDFYGLYAGQAQITNYSGNKPEKLKAAVSMLINLNDSELSIVSDGGNTTVFPISLIQLGPNVYLTGNDSTTTFSARLQPKGKSGKISFKGVGGHALFGYSYISDAKLKFKQVPPN